MDTDKILKLLQIMDLAKNWPQFQALHDAARAGLVEANEEAKAAFAERAEAARREEARASQRAARAEGQKPTAEEPKVRR